MDEIDPEIRAYYERGGEAGRLLGGFPSGPLELARTQEILLRYLGPPPLEILDVGGGPGAYAAWLAERGDRVHLIDPIALHVEQARAAHPKVTAEIGDVRKLPLANATVDAVLLLGPLYHLVDRGDRLLALGEARRALQPGGLLFAAAISRFAALLDLLVRLDRLHEPEVFRVVEVGVRTGVFRGADGELFTTAYLHRPEELREEILEAGFELDAVLNVEGPGFLVPDFETRWRDPARRDAILAAARLVESEAAMLGASSHLLAVARAPS
ncbi:MAG: class I SAM-dependent methyltransferase [Actinomycetota bacterium]